MIEIVDKYLTNLHPTTKLLFYINLFIFSIMGEILGVYLLGMISFFYLLLTHKDKKLIANPINGLILCIIGVIIVLPDGTKSEIKLAIDLSARILLVFNLFAISGITTNQQDYLFIAKIFGIKGNNRKIIIVLPLVLPLVVNVIHNVIMAQKSRGIELSFRKLMQFQTYQGLIVPYLVCVSKVILDYWISINLRPWSSYKVSIPRIKILDLGILLSIFIWLLNILPHN
ncbi:MAG: hypothetical protein M1480_06320 [Bacteroidetes bacterium]|nr:hypothetical protein [Bacteroidota bacterium]